MEYSNQYGSSMPSSVMNLIVKKDIDDSVMSYINTYNNYLKINDVTNAKKFFDEHRTTLSPYIINAEYLNQLQEEVYNSYVASQRNYCIVDIYEPRSDDQDINGIWYQEFS